MDLITLLIIIGSISIIITLVIGLIYKSHKSWIMTFLQNFTGVLFIFSGWVKAVDPMGTAFKMEQYFTEFEYTFNGTWFSFLSPVFPFLSNYSVGFSVFMITFEIILGIMLMLGVKTRFTSWAFLILVAFFTILTGFTFLTGYVPPDANFFSFSKWGAFNETNMKVTDCGCFGDFIKLKPKTSFLKDVVLLIPAILFVFRHKDMHQLFHKVIRNGLILISIVGVVIYCLSNFLWDIPHKDFRPFKINADIRTQKQQELQAMANVPLTYRITDKKSGETVMLPMDRYLEEYKKYPSEEFKLEQIKGEPDIPLTKVSEYEITSVYGDDMTDELMDYSGASIMIVSHKLKGNGKDSIRTVRDTIYRTDTIRIEGTDSIAFRKQIDTIETRQEEYMDYDWKDSFAKAYISGIKPFTDKALQDGIKVYAVVGGADESMIKDLKSDLQLNFDVYTADDILLKTIIRSNPGVLLWKDGKILYKWHYKKLPDYSAVRQKYLSM